MLQQEMIRWSAEYSVGVRLFDQQHHRLMNLINELHEAAMAGSAKQTSERALRELVAYTRMHFTAEERVLKQHGYPDFARHKQEHDKMAERALSFQREVQAGRPAASLNLSLVLSEWLKSHILVTDQQYSAFLAEHGVK